MKRLLFLISTVALLALCAHSQGSPVKPAIAQALSVPGMESRFSSLECKGGERSCAIAMGNGRSYLGLYVYDIHGNCVAWDDECMPQTRDDMAVEWYSPMKGTYVVEVRNSGLRSNDTKLWMR